MADTIRDLADDLEFGDLPPGAKRIVVERLGKEDEEFQALPAGAQKLVVDRLLNPPGTVQRIGQRIAAIPGRIAEGVQSAGRLLARGGGTGFEGFAPDVPDVPVPSTPRQDLRGLLEGITAPFELIAAPVGETVRTGLTALTRGQKTVPIVPSEGLEHVDVPRESFISAGQTAAELGAGFAVPAFPLTRAGLGIARAAGIGTRAPRMGLLTRAAEVVGRAGSEAAAAPEAARVFEALGGESSILGREFPGEAVARAASEGLRLPADVTAARLTTPMTQQLVQVTGDFMAASGIKRDPTIRVMYQAVDLLHRHPELTAGFNRQLESRGLSLLDFGRELQVTGSEAGRVLNQFSQLSKRIAQTPELRELADALGRVADPPGQWGTLQHVARRTLDLWRKALITAWSTATRNFVSQGIRVGINNLDEVLQVGFRHVTGSGAPMERAFTPAFRIGFDTVSALASRGKRARVDEILQMVPGQVDRLFARYSSDIARALEAAPETLGPIQRNVERAFQGADKALEVANFLNRWQEFGVRRAAVYAKLDQLLKLRGLDLRTIDVARIPAEDVAKAVDHALEMTFGASPKSGPWKAYLDLYKNPIGKILLTPTMPFPRFFYNFSKFVVDFSPAGFFRILTPGQRAALAAGGRSAHEVFSRAVIGTGMLGMAWEIRNSPEYAGEKWWELKWGDKRIDLRPWGPFHVTLAWAEAIKRYTDRAKQTGDDASALAETVAWLRDILPQARGTGGGVGQEALTFLEEITRGDPTDARFLRGVGEFVGGFAQPLTTFRELFAAYGQWKALPETIQEAAKEEAIIRDVRDAPLSGPTLRRIPGLSQTLSERQGALRAGPFTTETLGGFSRQLTGLSAQTRTAVEAEAARLEFRPADLEPRTGDPAADRLILQHMGPVAQRLLTPMIRAEAYQRLSDAKRRVVFMRVVQRVRRAAWNLAAREAPGRFAKIRFRQAVPRFERELLREEGLVPQELR